MKLEEISLPAGVKWMLALVAAYWASVPAVLQALIILMVADYITGLASAYVRKQLSSEIGFRGLVKKLLVLLLLIMCRWAESRMGMELGIEKIAAIGYAVNEFVSIIENIAKAGVPVPAPLVEALLRAKTFRRATPEQLAELERSRTQGSGQ